MAQHDATASLQAVRDYPEYGGLEVVPKHDNAPEVVQTYPEPGVTTSASPMDYKTWGKTGQEASTGHLPPAYHTGLHEAGTGSSSYPGYTNVPSHDSGPGRGAGNKGTQICGLPRRVFWILVGVVSGVVILAVALGAGLGAGLQHSSNSSVAAAVSVSSTVSPITITTTTASASTSTSSSTSSTSSTSTSSITSSTQKPYITGPNTIPAPSATATLKSTLDISCPNDNLTLYKDTTEDKTYILLCGRDYNAAGGSVDLASQNATSMAECIGICASNDTCTAAGWGFYDGANVCWLKTSINTPNDSDGWYFVVEESGANL